MTPRKFDIPPTLNVYLICSSREGDLDEAHDIIKATWDDRYPLGDSAFLVVDEAATSGDIRDKFVQAADDIESPPLFLVVPVEFYAGYNRTHLWEWLEKKVR